MRRDSETLRRDVRQQVGKCVRSRAGRRGRPLFGGDRGEVVIEGAQDGVLQRQLQGVAGGDTIGTPPSNGLPSGRGPRTAGCAPAASGINNSDPTKKIDRMLMEITEGEALSSV